MSAFTATVTPHTATEPGALNGFRMTCSCGATWTTLFERQAYADADTHLAWHGQQKSAVPAVVLPAKTGKRHYCRAGASSTFSVSHTKGDGTPRAKKCTYCRGELVVETGYFGVFVWAGENRYPLEDAVKVYSSPAAAEKFARANARDNLVVRWISA